MDSAIGWDLRSIVENGTKFTVIRSNGTFFEPCFLWILQLNGILDPMCKMEPSHKKPVEIPLSKVLDALFQI